MAQPVSRVPHLAQAIIEKKCLQSGTRKIEATQRTRLASILPSGAAPTYRSYSSQSEDRHSEHVPAQRSPSIPVKPRQNLESNALFNRPRPRPSSPFHPNGKQPASNASDDSEKTRRFFVRYFLPFSALLGGYVMYSYISYIRDKQNYEMREDKLVLHSDVSDRWKNEKRDFDKEINSQETVLLMKAKRRRLIREAYGDVLEVSCGTGRNMDLYDTRPYHPTEDGSYGRSSRHMITSLTFNDQSPVMMEHAKSKWEEKQKSKRHGDRFNGEVKWINGDARQPGVISRPPGGYDTIVQSMGICSMTEPANFLRLLGRLVRQPGEEVQNTSPKKFREQEAEDGRGGRIFLLEHGKGKSEWLNNFLDSFAPMHADRYGCWCNKDIGKVIEDSGLIVERVKQYQFGTVWEIVLRPTTQPLPIENSESSLPIKGDQVKTSDTIKARVDRWISSIWK